MKAKLQEEIKTAMKARDEKLLLVLRGLMSEWKREEIDSRQELTEEKAVQIVQKEIEKRRDTIEFAEKGGREDIVSQSKFEIEVLQRYLGEQLSEEELKNTIDKLIAGGADSVGKIMGALQKDYRGKFEGKVASALARARLSQQ
jgi:uncharacterized protein YqeY